MKLSRPSLKVATGLGVGLILACLGRIYYLGTMHDVFEALGMVFLLILAALAVSLLTGQAKLRFPDDQV